MKNGLCTLTVNSWGGPAPLPGEYVKAARGRTAYLIVRVKSTRVKHVSGLVCERYRAERLGPQDVVHPWKWAAR